MPSPATRCLWGAHVAYCGPGEAADCRLMMKWPRIIAGLGAALLVAGCGSTVVKAADVTPSPAITVTQTPTPVVTVTQTPIPAITVTQPPAPAPAPVVTVTPPQKLANASAVVAQFYQDITNGDYASAWALGGKNIGGMDYRDWVAGYATTASIILRTESEWNSTTVYATLVATQTNGNVYTYAGTYTVTNGVITGANIVKTN
jgi:hypothetical protein